MQDDNRSWLYATSIMLVVSLIVLICRIGSIVLFTLEFEIALVYIPTIVLIAVSLHLIKAGERSTGPSL